MTIIYTDTSALIKRVVVEPESMAVRRLLRERHAAGDVFVASALAWLEVWRSLRRVGVRDLDVTAAAALSGVAEIPLSDDLLVRARRIGSDVLRSLDAIHLTSAVTIGATAVLTYDDRLAQAAIGAGFDVLGPGPGNPQLAAR